MANWEHLKTFYEITKYRTLTEAGEEMNKSQSALSRTLMNLEEQLGYKLCWRDKTGIVLTEKGKEIFEAAEHMFGALSHAKKQVHNSDTLEGKIRLCITSAVLNYIVLKYVAEFKKTHPYVDFDIICQDQAVDLARNEVDIAIFPPQGDISDKYTQEIILNLKPYIYGSNEYFEKFGIPESAEELHNHKFISLRDVEKYPHANLLWYFDLNRKITKNNITLTSNCVETLLIACKKGIGLFTSYKEMEPEKNFNLICIEDIDSQYSIKSQIITLKSSENIEKVSEFKKFLITKLRI